MAPSRSSVRRVSERDNLIFRKFSLVFPSHPIPTENLQLLTHPRNRTIAVQRTQPHTHTRVPKAMKTRCDAGRKLQPGVLDRVQIFPVPLCLVWTRCGKKVENTEPAVMRCLNFKKNHIYDRLKCTKDLVHLKH